MGQLTVADWPILAAAVLALVAAGAVQGAIGFGFNMLAAPVLAVLDARFVPGPMLLLAMLVCVGGAWREIDALDRRGLGYALTGRLMAAMPAVLCLGLLSAATFSLVFGIIVLLAVAASVWGPKLAPTPVALVSAGAVSGFMGTLTAIGAAPMAMVYQNADGRMVRATLNAFFVVGGAISLAALALGERMGWGDLVLTIGLVPFAFVGFALSGPLRRLLDKGRIRVAVLTVSALSGLVLIVRGLT